MKADDFINIHTNHGDQYVGADAQGSAQCALYACKTDEDTAGYNQNTSNTHT